MVVPSFAVSFAFGINWELYESITNKDVREVENKISFKNLVTRILKCYLCIQTGLIHFFLKKMAFT